MDGDQGQERNGDIEEYSKECGGLEEVRREGRKRREREDGLPHRAPSSQNSRSATDCP